MKENPAPEIKKGDEFPGGLQAVWLGGALLAGLALIVAMTAIESSRRGEVETAVEITAAPKSGD